MSLWTCGAEGSLYEWDMVTGERRRDIFTNKNGHLGLAVKEAAYTVGTDGHLKEIINGEVFIIIIKVYPEVTKVI